MINQQMRTVFPNIFQYIVVVFGLWLVYVYPTLNVIVTCTFMRAVFKTLCRPFTLAGS